MVRSIKDIIDTAMEKASLILKEKSKKRIKYNKKVENRKKLKNKR